MDKEISIKNAAALRQRFQLDKRLELEFRAVISRLLRDFEVNTEEGLLDRLTMAGLEELPSGMPLKKETSKPAGDPPVAPIGPQPPPGGLREIDRLLGLEPNRDTKSVRVWVDVPFS